MWYNKMNKGAINLPITKTQVRFAIEDALVQKVYDAAEKKSLDNIQNFCGRNVLVEGGGYHKIWLETQPMGGEMYAKRNIEAALNNQLMFMEHQRADGRLPGSITVTDGQIRPEFNKFQGFCFPFPALNMYYWANLDKAYLEQLRTCLIRFDEYMWKTRDSNNDGCLEAWCITDTGEDGAVRYGDAPFWWTEDTPPQDAAVVPIQSMDFMAFSISARKTLAKVSELLGTGEKSLWQEKAKAVQDKLKSYLWDDKRGACFDRDKHGNTMDILLHNNLRVMYWNGFDQAMADRFVKEHLLNEKEFWTPFPLPSVAANDKMFRNHSENDWSGQPEGLTYQRAIRALTLYGYDYLLPILSDKLISAIGENCRFTQQFDPFTGALSSEKDGYGPTMLSVLEYISRLYGFHLEGEAFHFGLRGGKAFEYEQIWGDKTFLLRSNGKKAEVSLNGKMLFKSETGVKIVTDWDGNITQKISLEGKA
jgi:Neutral trehalase